MMRLTHERMFCITGPLCGEVECQSHGVSNAQREWGFPLHQHTWSDFLSLHSESIQLIITWWGWPMRGCSALLTLCVVKLSVSPMVSAMHREKEVSLSTNTHGQTFLVSIVNQYSWLLHDEVDPWEDVLHYWPSVWWSWVSVPWCQQCTERRRFPSPPTHMVRLS